MSLCRTRWSVVLAAGTADAAGREALAWLCRQYWDPLRAHARRRGWRDDEDAVQDFLIHLIERCALAQADPLRGRFRAWLFTCLDHFLASRAAAAAALKRGGGAGRASPAAAVAEPADRSDFDRDWAATVLARAEDVLEREVDPLRWQALQPFLAANGDAEAYRACGLRMGLGEGAVKVAVHRLRHRLRELVRLQVAETLGDDDARLIDAELDHFIAVLAERR